MTSISSDRHVAVLPFPFTSHPNSVLALVRHLAVRAPNVIFSFYCFPESIETLFAPDKKVPGNIKPYAVSDGVPEGYVFSGNPFEPVKLYLAAVEEGERLKDVLKAAEAEIGRRIGCVLSDAFMYFAGDLAEEMEVPWVPFRTGDGWSISALFYADLIRESTVDIASWENELVKFVPGFLKIRLRDLPREVLFGNLESPFTSILQKMGRALPKATAVVVNSVEELDPEIYQDLKSKFKMFLNVGPTASISSSSASLSPPPYSDEYGCIPWLDNHEAASVAYIAFGTVFSPPPLEIAALAEALEATNTPFLWSLKDNSREFLPEGFEKRTTELGKIVSWTPQKQVLTHSSVGVFVTHCGWNSVLEGISAGVPLIGRPFVGDQYLNTSMVQNVWRIGVKVEGGVLTKNGTMSALGTVLSHEKGKEFREQVGKFKELILKAVGPEGSSTRNFNTLLEVVTGHDLM